MYAIAEFGIASWRVRQAVDGSMVEHITAMMRATNDSRLNGGAVRQGRGGSVTQRIWRSCMVVKARCSAVLVARQVECVRVAVAFSIRGF